MVAGKLLLGFMTGNFNLKSIQTDKTNLDAKVDINFLSHLNNNKNWNYYSL
jgi:hypothetical protein